VARDILDFEYPKKLHFKCDKCALCCGDTEEKTRRILLMKPEADRISRETSKDVAEFADRIEGWKPYVYEMKKASNGKCMFLECDTCHIYGFRPLICRFYPFELKASGSGTHVFAHTHECPCIGQGPELKRDYFERLFAESEQMMKKARVQGH
jgi:Fe-S-cluster containining protein